MITCKGTFRKEYKNNHGITVQTILSSSLELPEKVVQENYLDEWSINVMKYLLKTTNDLQCDTLLYIFRLNITSVLFIIHDTSTIPGRVRWAPNKTK